jgi:hypothetical protein
MLAVVLSAIRDKSFQVYTRPFELNIVGVRSNSAIPNRFDDSLHVFFKNAVGSWMHYVFPVTTDPGTYWLKNPLNEQGTAILKQGQYRGAYGIGLHRGLYKALVQQKPVTVIRDYDRNAVLDFQNGRVETGMFGINIHHAAQNGTTKTVDRYSAGCQVFASINEFNAFMQLCEKHKALYGNSFTYTLIDRRAIAREQKKKLAFYIGGLSVGASAAFITYKILKP